MDECSSPTPREGMEVNAVQPRLTISVEEAGRLLGISRGAAYEAARRGELPVLRFGRRLVIPRAQLMAMLGEREPLAAES